MKFVTFFLDGFVPGDASVHDTFEAAKERAQENYDEGVSATHGAKFDPLVWKEISKGVWESQNADDPCPSFIMEAEG